MNEDGIQEDLPGTEPVLLVILRNFVHLSKPVREQLEP